LKIFPIVAGAYLCVFVILVQLSEYLYHFSSKTSHGLRWWESPSPSPSLTIQWSLLRNHNFFIKNKSHHIL